MKNLYLSALAAAALLSFTACKEETDPGPAQEAAKTEAVNRYADLALLNYEAALQGAVTMQTSIEAFLNSPSESSLMAARQAWKTARTPYSRTEVFRFYGGPIDSETGPEGLINSWPMDESYVDYVAGIEDTISLIARTDAAAITPEFLAERNQADGETNVTTGYHAIEFLLWGQDQDAAAAGRRPFTDYTTAPHAEARKAFLRAATQLLITNLTEVRDAWKQGAEYRNAFTGGSKDAALGNIFRGMGALAKAETGGERTRVALANQDQEDEQSCFSDNTKADIVNNIEGILYVYNGVFQPVNGEAATTGTSPFDVIAKRDAVKANLVRTKLVEALSVANEIPDPFDQAIISADGRAKVEATADRLGEAADAIVNAAAVYGITVSAEGE